MDEWNVKKGASSLSADEAEEVETKFLINIVKRSPFVYDPSHIKSDEYKLIFWERVAKIMCISNGHKVAEKWDKLKYEFTFNAKRQKMIKKGILNSPYQLWKYMIEMKFLLPFVEGVTEDDLYDKEETLEDENDVQRLITEIMNTPVLYDPTHSEYKNFLARHYNWTVIANKFKNCSVESVKETWRIIKSSYLRVLKRNTSNLDGLFRGPLVRYKYEEELDFILPFLKENNFTDDDVDNERSFYIKDDETIASSICEESEQEVEVEEVTQAESIPDEQDDHPPDNQESQQPDNSMYHFFMSIYSSTNELPAALQLEMKKKIFNAVTSAEELWWESTSAPSSKQS